jgi:uncharacterized protein YndB with AHSA1/START domain
MTSARESVEPEGQVERIGDDYVVRFERRLAHPIERVWKAITEPDELIKWFADARTLELREGGNVEFEWLGSNQGPGMRGKIVSLDPPRLVEWAGEPPAHPAARCRLELRTDGDECVLSFSSKVPVEEVDRRAAEDPVHWSPPSMLAGWHTHMDALEDALEGGSMDWDNPSMERWQELYEAYGGERR